MNTTYEARNSFATSCQTAASKRLFKFNTPQYGSITTTLVFDVEGHHRTCDGKGFVEVVLK